MERTEVGGNGDDECSKEKRKEGTAGAEWRGMINTVVGEMFGVMEMMGVQKKKRKEKKPLL